MSEKLGKILKGTTYGLFLLAFAWISGQLFFEKQTNNLMASIFVGQGILKPSIEDLRVVYADEPTSLEPTLYDPTTRQRLVNIFEPLVKLDRDLNTRPGLAISWGMLDDLNWKISLRPDVKFQDGSGLDSPDVKASFERAMKNKNSQLTGILDTIDKVEILDDSTLKITTKKPDPLLLQRLSTVLIFPSEQSDKTQINPDGTGPYKFSSWKQGDRLILERNENYWGDKPKFAKVEMIVIPNKSARVGALVNNNADLLDFVPFDGVQNVLDQGFKIAAIPGLEVQFLVFNTKSAIFSDTENRKVFSMAIDDDTLVKALGGNFARTISQFVSNGIFGFNPDIIPHVYDIAQAKKMAEAKGLKDQTITFHLPKTLELLGEHVRTQLAKIGVDVLVSYMDGDKFAQSLTAGDADVYFLGFKADIGDASDFLNTLAYSKGSFNIGHYVNTTVDKLIEDSSVQMDPAKRLKNLKDAMKIVVEDDVYGVPLFEYQKIFAFSKKLDLQPRIDGLIYFDEINIK